MKFGDELRDRIVESDFSALNEDPDRRRRRRHFRERRRIEDRLLGHRLFARHERAFAIRAMHGVAVVLHPEHATGQFVFRDRAVDGVIDRQSCQQMNHSSSVRKSWMSAAPLTITAAIQPIALD